MIRGQCGGAKAGGKSCVFDVDQLVVISPMLRSKCRPPPTNTRASIGGRCSARMPSSNTAVASQSSSLQSRRRCRIAGSPVLPSAVLSEQWGSTFPSWLSRFHTARSPRFIPNLIRFRFGRKQSLARAAHASGRQTNQLIVSLTVPAIALSGMSVSDFGPVADRPLLGNGARCRRHPLHHLASTRLLDLLRPHIIQARGDALLAAQLGNAVVTAQAVPHDPHLMFRRERPRVAPRSPSPPAPQATWQSRI